MGRNQPACAGVQHIVAGGVRGACRHSSVAQLQGSCRTHLWLVVRPDAVQWVVGDPVQAGGGLAARGVGSRAGSGWGGRRAGGQGNMVSGVAVCWGQGSHRPFSHCGLNGIACTVSAGVPVKAR